MKKPLLFVIFYCIALQSLFSWGYRKEIAGNAWPGSQTVSEYYAYDLLESDADRQIVFDINRNSTFLFSGGEIGFKADETKNLKDSSKIKVIIKDDNNTRRTFGVSGFAVESGRYVLRLKSEDIRGIALIFSYNNHPSMLVESDDFAYDLGKFECSDFSIDIKCIENGHDFRGGFCFSCNKRANDVNSMVYIDGGLWFDMRDTRYDYDMDEIVEDKVLARVDSFYISSHEVTQAEWYAVMKTNPSYFKGCDLPVENVSWYDAVEFCNAKSLKEGFAPCYKMDGGVVACDFKTNGYRLPTEAEWFYAADEGIRRKYYAYCGGDVLDELGWYRDNSEGRTRRVMTKSPNSFGLYDMSGNVAEWCWDRYCSYLSGGENPVGLDYKLNLDDMSSSVKGGSWASQAWGCTIFERSCHTTDKKDNRTGFRVVRSIM